VSIYKDRCILRDWLTGATIPFRTLEITFLKNCVQNVSCPLDIGYISHEKSGWSLLLAVLVVSFKLRDVRVYLDHSDSAKNRNDSMIKYCRLISRISAPKWKSNVWEAVSVSVVRE
jgi:hypothetical protein